MTPNDFVVSLIHQVASAANAFEDKFSISICLQYVA